MENKTFKLFYFFIWLINEAWDSKISWKIFLSCYNNFCLLSNQFSKFLFFLFVDYDSLWWFGLVLIQLFRLLIFSWWELFFISFVSSYIVFKIKLKIFESIFLLKCSECWINLAIFMRKNAWKLKVWNDIMRVR